MYKKEQNYASSTNNLNQNSDQHQTNHQNQTNESCPGNDSDKKILRWTQLKGAEHFKPISSFYSLNWKKKEDKRNK